MVCVQKQHLAWQHNLLRAIQGGRNVLVAAGLKAGYLGQSNEESLSSPEFLPQCAISYAQGVILAVFLEKPDLHVGDSRLCGRINLGFRLR